MHTLSLFWLAVLADLRQMTWIEGIAVISAFASVYLTLRNNIWTWLWGLISVIAYGWVFWTTHDFGNAGLNFLYYVPLQIWGWYAWLRFGPKRDDDLPITAMPTRSRVGSLVITLGLCVLAFFLLRLTNDPHPIGDGFTTAVCIVAQYLEVYKRWENWLFWIVADIVYVVYLFPVEHLYLSTLLYVAFTAMSIVGARNWRRLLVAPTERPLAGGGADVG